MKSTQARYGSLIHGSVDARTVSPMMQQPHHQANNFSSHLIHNGHYHAAPYYSHQYWNHAGYRSQHGYVNNRLYSYESPPPPQHPHYMQVSPDTRFPPPNISLRSESPGDSSMMAAGCTCKKSRCLKLYCQCFGSSTTCGNRCRCQSCHNTTLHAKDIKEAKRSILDRNPSAFESKFQGNTPAAHSANTMTAAAENWRLGQMGNSQQVRQIQVLPTAQSASKIGCRCKKSFCLKKYCECFQNQVHCGLNCACLNCKNHPLPTEVPKKTQVPRTVTRTVTPASTKEQSAKDEITPEKLTGDGESEDSITMIAAVAMTELFGKVQRQVSVEVSKSSGNKGKRKLQRSSETGSPSSKELDTTPAQKSRRVLFNASPGVQRTIPRKLSSGHPANPAVGHVSSSPFHPRFTHQQPHAGPFPYHFHPPKPSPTYKDVIKSSGLPRALSFRKICSKCGRTRGEHAELGFGNKCVFNDCARCGAERSVHEQNGCPMGILCSLTVKDGATPGQANKYDRKIRDLAARAELQKSLKGKATDDC